MLRTLIEKNVGVKQLKQIFWTDLIREIGLSLRPRQYINVDMVGITCLWEKI